MTRGFFKSETKTLVGIRPSVEIVFLAPCISHSSHAHSLCSVVHIRNCFLLSGSCTRQDDDNKPWWQIDLQRIEKVVAVQIHDNYGKVITKEASWKTGKVIVLYKDYTSHRERIVNRKKT